MKRFKNNLVKFSRRTSKAPLITALITLLATSMAFGGWIRTFGGSGGDQGRCVREIDDGYIIAGTTGSYGEGILNLWLLKTDTSGAQVWSKTYGTADFYTSGSFIDKTTDGGYVVTGNWGDTICLVKTDVIGDTLWMKTYSEGAGSCVQQTQDGGYIIAGIRFYGSTAFPSHFLMIKTNSQGDTLWSKKYLLENWAYSWGNFVQQTADKGFIATGYIGDTTFEAEREAHWLFKTDSLGEIEWSYIQGGENWGDEDGGVCVRATSDNYYIALANYWLTKLNTLGDSLWSQDYRYGSCIQETQEGSYVFCGNEGVFNLDMANLGKTWLFKTDNNGDSTWQRGYFQGVSSYLEETHDKGFIVTGYKDGDLFLLKTDSLGLLGITENPIIETDNGWNVPHSIGSYIVLHYQGLPQGFRANVFDVSGRQVDRIRGDGNEGAMTWGINQPPGVYFIQALDNQNQLKTAKVVLVR